jgi:hypothetical protein
MSGLITAINIAYEEKERRGFLRFNLIALGLTLGVVVGGGLAIALIAVLPAAVQLLTVGRCHQCLGDTPGQRPLFDQRDMASITEFRSHCSTHSSLYEHGVLGTCSLWNFPFQSRADLHLIDPRPLGMRSSTHT